MHEGFRQHCANIHRHLRQKVTIAETSRKVRISVTGAVCPEVNSARVKAMGRDKAKEDVLARGIDPPNRWGILPGDELLCQRSWPAELARTLLSRG